MVMSRHQSTRQTATSRRRTAFGTNDMQKFNPAIHICEHPFRKRNVELSASPWLRVPAPGCSAVSAAVRRNGSGNDGDGDRPSQPLPPTLGLEDVAFDDYIGEMRFTMVETYSKGSQVPGVAVPLGSTPKVETRGKSSVRLFRGRLCDPTVRTRGGDTRCLVKEFGAQRTSGEGGRECLAMAGREAETLWTLEDAWARRDRDADVGDGSRGGKSGTAKGQPFGDLLGSLFSAMSEATSAATRGAGSPAGQEDASPPFVRLIGDMSAAVSDATIYGTVDFDEWEASLDTAPPRAGASWLVYEWAGFNTVKAFAVPTAERVARAEERRKAGAAAGVLGLPPSPKLVDWGIAADFVISIAEQAIQAVGFVHDTGFAHRSLSGDAILLSSISQDKTTALQQCTPELLVVKLTNFGFSSVLGDASEARLDAAARWGVDGRSTLALASLSIAEDFHALGLTLLSLLLGALAEVYGESPPPRVSESDLERQIDDLFDGSVASFRDYALAEPTWERVVSLLDADGGAGWEVITLMIESRQAVASRSLSMLTANSLLSHRFFGQGKNP